MRDHGLEPLRTLTGGVAEGLRLCLSGGALDLLLERRGDPRPSLQ